jgi:predicted CXXCH cytochrome family protein
MKKLIYFSIVLFAFGLTLPSIGQVGITNSAHDFSGQNWAPATNKKCAVCHATHHAKNETSAPLWNHQSTTVVFTPYTSPTFNATGSSPSASSKLCLSCHDGTVAIENFGNTTSGTTFISAANKVGGGGDLTKDHPVSFEYTSGLATTDGGLKDPTTAVSGLGGTIQANLLYSNRMECASCHDVHNKAGIAKLLRLSNTTSQLCLTCHIK